MHEAKAGMSKHVKSRDQALAIAYSIKRRGRRHGGRTYDYGGFVNPAAAPVSGPTNTVPPLASPVSTPLSAPATYSPPPAQAAPPGPFAAPPSPMGGFGANIPGFNSLASMAPSWAHGFGEANSYLSQLPGFPGFSGAGGPQPTMMSDPAMSGPTGGFNPPTGFSGMNQQPQGFALGGAPAPWFVRNESRAMMHTGPVTSIVPGRTDRHNMNVPSGAYVLPASVISHLGQSNTNAGMAIAHKMFGSGPFGSPTMKMGRGAGLPRPPKPMGIPSDRGGARGSHAGKPTPVVVAGGEYVIDPAKVAEIGGGSLEQGHRVLDQFVKQIHKKHAKEIAKLPPPAKS